MSRHRFRSQPALDRSGGRTPSAILGLCLLAGVALGAGALVSNIMRGPAPGPDGVQAIAPLDQPASLGAALDTPAPQAPPAAQPQPSLQANATPQVSPAPVVRLKAAATARTARRAKPANAPAAKPPSAQEQWEQQRLDYERARDAYDANERSEGYRWAQQNRIRLQRYCHVAEQRTPAFVEGCISYLRPAAAKRPETNGSDKPRESGGPRPSDEG